MRKALTIGDVVEYAEVFHSKTWPLEPPMYEYLARLCRLRAELVHGVALGAPDRIEHRLSARETLLSYRSKVIGSPPDAMADGAFALTAMVLRQHCRREMAGDRANRRSAG